MLMLLESWDDGNMLGLYMRIHYTCKILILGIVIFETYWSLTLCCAIICIIYYLLATLNVGNATFFFLTFLILVLI